MSKKEGLTGLTGGSGFWKDYAEKVVSRITNNYAYRDYLTGLKERYEELVESGNEYEQCGGCGYHVSSKCMFSCNVCQEPFCMSQLPQCVLKWCACCRKPCCLSDRSFDNRGNLVCIDCVDYHGDRRSTDGDAADSSMVLESDSEHELSESEEEEEEGSENE